MSEIDLVRTALPIPDRSCGYCTVCCYAPQIDAPELQKLPGVVCPNCTGRGCGIYQTRPPVCRDFNCGWRFLPQLSDDWRPDRSGVLILTLTENIPPGYAVDWGLQLLVLGAEETIRRTGFIEFIIAAVNDGIPIYVAAPGPTGKTGAHAFLNRIVAAPARQLDRQRVLNEVLDLYREAAECPPSDIIPKHGL